MKTVVEVYGDSLIFVDFRRNFQCTYCFGSPFDARVCWCESCKENFLFCGRNLCYGRIREVDEVALSMEEHPDGEGVNVE